jgi:hypothetical protein
MPPVLAPILVWWIIQIIKVTLDVIKKKAFKRKYLRWSWWFPSVHSWIASSIITLTYLLQWINDVSFAIALSFWFLMWYDSVNVRYEAGRHAHQLNQIRYKLEKKKHKYNLKERIGHTPWEVIWWILAGTLITYLLYTAIWFH